jgi:hypothetical protein
MSGVRPGAPADVSAFVHVEGLTDVPNVADDDAVVAAYEGAKLRFIRRLVEDAEDKIHETYVARRDALAAEVETLRALSKTHEDAAKIVVARYATRMPHRVSRSGVHPPSLWERIVTFNAVGAVYRAAADGVARLAESNEALRKRRAGLDALEREARRAVYLREEQARKKLQTPEGLAALHADPQVQAAFLKAQAVMDRREAYQLRVERGEVPPEEARDRDMAARGQRFACAPMHGTIVTRVVRFGTLHYYVLRDLSNAEFLLACDPALEPLRDLVFDVTQGERGLDAELRYAADGTPIRVLDHLKATRTADDATDAYARHRESLRTERPSGITPAHDEAEAAVVAVLRLLAEAVSQHGLDADG